MTIGDDSLWNGLQKVEGFLEKGFRRCHIPMLAEKDVHQVAVFVNAAIEVTPFAAYLYISFVREPRVSNFMFVVSAVTEQ